MKSNTVSTNMFSHNKSFSKSFFPLPVIYQPIKITNMSDNKIKERIIELKKELNKHIAEYNELKIGMLKLESEKEVIKKILDNAIIESKTNEKPIELSSNSSLKEMAISKQSYSRLQKANVISSLKHQVSLTQKQIKEKQEEIVELKSDSKIVKLLEKNNQLVEIHNRITIISKQIDNLNVIAKDKENKAKDDMIKRDCYKAKFNNIKNEIEMLKDKYKTSMKENEIQSKKIEMYVEKANNLKYKYNKSKQTERDIDNEIRFYEEKYVNEGKLLEDKDKNSEECKKYSKEIQQLKEEIKQKNNEIKSLENENDDCVSIIKKEENNNLKAKANENSQIEIKRKEISKKKKDIQVLKEENEALLNETNLLTIKLQNKAENMYNKRCEICSDTKLTFIRMESMIRSKEKPLLSLNNLIIKTKNDNKDKLISNRNKNHPHLSSNTEEKVSIIDKTTLNINQPRIHSDN